MRGEIAEMKSVFLWALVAYFVAKYVIEPSPVGAIVASVLAPIGGMISGLVGGVGQ